MMLINLGLYTHYVLITTVIQAVSKPSNPVWYGLIYIRSPILMIIIEPMLHGNVVMQLLGFILYFYALTDAYMNVRLKTGLEWSILHCAVFLIIMSVVVVLHVGKI